MKNLQRRTGMVSNFAQLSERDRLLLHGSSSIPNIPVNGHTGMRKPLHLHKADSRTPAASGRSRNVDGKVSHVDVRPTPISIPSTTPTASVDDPFRPVVPKTNAQRTYLKKQQTAQVPYRGSPRLTPQTHDNDTGTGRRTSNGNRTPISNSKKRRPTLEFAESTSPNKKMHSKPSRNSIKIRDNDSEHEADGSFDFSRS